MTRIGIELALVRGAFSLDVAIALETRALCLFGPSGSGKSSVLDLLAGLDRPARGRVTLGDEVWLDTAAAFERPARERRVGYVPQDVLLFPHLRVRDNVAYGVRPGTNPPLARLAALLELDPLMDRWPASLSGGERQRVALARALASSPALLLLDEPLAAVDLARRGRILSALREVRDDWGVPLVYVTHAPDEALAIADHVVVLSDGRVAASGRAREVLGHAAGAPETPGAP